MHATAAQAPDSLFEGDLVTYSFREFLKYFLGLNEQGLDEFKVTFSPVEMPAVLIEVSDKLRLITDEVRQSGP